MVTPFPNKERPLPDRSTVLLIAAACLMVLALTSWHRYLMARVEPPRPYGCESVPSARLKGADYYRGAWQLPDGRVLGWSAEEDSTVYTHPGCY